jgi:hypothetical protein
MASHRTPLIIAPQIIDDTFQAVESYADCQGLTCHDCSPYDLHSEFHCQDPIQYHYLRPRLPPRAAFLDRSCLAVMSSHGHKPNDVIWSYPKRGCENDRKLCSQDFCILPL